METCKIAVGGRVIEVPGGMTLLGALSDAGIPIDAVCNGAGTCKKCKVLVNGDVQLACQTGVDRDMEIVLFDEGHEEILTTGVSCAIEPDGTDRYAIAYDIGTTTVVAYLLDGMTGQELAVASGQNPQRAHGADVVTRIQYALKGGADELQGEILDLLGKLTAEAAAKAGIGQEEVTIASMVGNTCMHHLALHLDVEPLTTPPYMPSVFEALALEAAKYLPISPNGVLRVLPNIAGFVGADTVGCLVAMQFDQLEEQTLLIDIGTNGEMVLGNGARRVACSTAAGPAFEGAKIECGMRGALGAIDHVKVDSGDLVCSTIGGARARGLCGSGLLDATAALLDLGVINKRGRMKIPESLAGRSAEGDLGGLAITLKDGVWLSQKDIREVQLAKGAIRAGVELMSKYAGIPLEDVSTCRLAGAFGNYLDPESACKIGMLPPLLLSRVVPIGNAAGEGAKRCALCESEFARAIKIAEETEFLELATLDTFQDRFIKSNYF